jgi:hypothetical protein
MALPSAGGGCVSFFYYFLFVAKSNSSESGDFLFVIYMVNPMLVANKIELAL